MCLYDARLPVRPGTPFVNDARRNEETLETVETVAARAFQSVQTRVIEKTVKNKTDSAIKKKRRSDGRSDEPDATSDGYCDTRTNRLYRFKRDDV